jgi:glycosyltransferase involved in cell wall biosynthesis
VKILFPYMARWHAVNWTRYHSLLVALADLGHEVVVLQPPSAALNETNFQEIAAVDHPRIRLVEVPIAGWLWKRKWPLDKLVKRLAYGRSAIRVARKMLRAEKFDVVLTYNIPQYKFMFLDVPVRVFDYADDYVNMLAQELGPLDNRVARRMATYLLKRMMEQSRVVTSVSKELTHGWKQPMQVLPNGVSLQKAARGKQLPAPQTRVNGKPIIGYVGAFEYFIDWRCMIDSAKLLPECHFLLVGSGRDWEATRKYAAEQGVDNVEFTGGVPHNQVFAYINRFDVCLNLFVPIEVSHRACPIKLFEYLSMEKPVISTRLDELRHVDTGFLYYAANATEVASQVRQILGDPQTAASRVQAGHELVVRSYEWTAIARRFETLVTSQAKASA